MNKNIFASVILCSSIALAGIVSSSDSAKAQDAKKNYVGPSIGFGSAGGSGTTLFGVNSKFGVADSVSVRPYVQFGSFAGVSITSYGATATYDFSLPKSEFAPYAGIGFGGITASGGGGSATGSGLAIELGGDYNVSDSIALNANYRILTNNGSVSVLNIGGGFKF
jgi:opacity protein-like surface antigen